MKEKTIIAVWGTLMKGNGNNFRLFDSKLLGTDYLTGYTKSGLTLTKTGNNEDKVPVEVYEVDDEVFKSVDRFENVFGYFGKKVKLESGQKALVWFNR